MREIERDTTYILIETEIHNLLSLPISLASLLSPPISHTNIQIQFILRIVISAFFFNTHHTDIIFFMHGYNWLYQSKNIQFNDRCISLSI